MFIIALMLGVALPQLLGYLRVASIRAAQNELMAEIQAARFKAIARNVRYGVAFVILSPTTYQYVIGDDLQGTNTVNAPQISALAALPAPNPQLGGLRSLPAGVSFAAGCSGFVANAAAFRFSRLGTWCNPGAGQCAAVDIGSTLIQNNAAGTTICLLESRTGLFRQVFVDPGGRVRLDS